MKLLQKILSHGLLIAFLVGLFFLYQERTELFPQWFGKSTQHVSAPVKAGNKTPAPAPAGLAPPAAQTAPEVTQNTASVARMEADAAQETPVAAGVDTPAAEVAPGRGQPAVAGEPGAAVPATPDRPVPVFRPLDEEKQAESAPAVSGDTTVTGETAAAEEAIDNGTGFRPLEEQPGTEAGAATVEQQSAPLTEPVTESVVEAEPVVTTEPVVAVEPAVTTGSVVAVETAVTTETVAEEEPVATTEPAVGAETVVTTEPAIAAEPVVTAEPVPAAGEDIAAAPESVTRETPAHATGDTDVALPDLAASQPGIEQAAVEPAAEPVSPTADPAFQTRLEQARSLYWQRNTRAALQAYRELAKDFPDSAQAWGELGNLYFNLRQAPAAADAYAHAIDLLIAQGEFRRAHQLLGVMYRLNTRQAQQLETRLRKAGG